MFKKILASFGKGAATVDLKFDDRPYQAGETIKGEVIIEGGQVEQKINDLTIRLIMNVFLKKRNISKKIALIPLIHREGIKAKEQKVIPFEFVIPKNIPVSRESVSFFFDTHLKIESGVDRKDIDQLIIQPQKSVQVIFQVMCELGFRESAASGTLDRFGQEFSFFPTYEFIEQVKQVKIRFANEQSGIRIWMEVDCNNGMEAKRECKLDWNTLEHEMNVKKQLRKHISEVVERPHAYTQPFSYTTHHHQGSVSHLDNAIPGMIGGLAVGVLGTVLLADMMEELDLEDEDDVFVGGFDSYFDGDGND